MKAPHKVFLPSILTILFIAIGASRLLAYDHDDQGWFDSHRGYWDHDKSGARIFISI